MTKNISYMVVLTDRYKNDVLFDRMFDTVELALQYIENVKKYSVGLSVELRKYVENEGYVTLMKI